MINPDRLTVKSTETLNDALALARRNGNPLVYDLHLLHALLGQDEGIVVPILQKLGVAVPQLREAVEREIGRYPKQSEAQPTLSREMNAVVDRAEAEAKGLAGKVYLDARGIKFDPAQDTGHGYGGYDESLREAAALLEGAKLAVTLDDLRMAARRKDPAALERLQAIRAERFELMAGLAKLPPDTVFFTQITMEAAEDGEFLDAMRRAHIKGALVGIEAVTPEGLKDVYKGFNASGEALMRVSFRA